MWQRSSNLIRAQKKFQLIAGSVEEREFLSVGYLSFVMIWDKSDRQWRKDGDKLLWKKSWIERRWWNRMHEEKKAPCFQIWRRKIDIMLVVDVGADQTGGGGVEDPPCIKIGYSSRKPRRVFRPCIKIGYVSAKY